MQNYHCDSCLTDFDATPVHVQDDLGQEQTEPPCCPVCFDDNSHAVDTDRPGVTTE